MAFFFITSLHCLLSSSALFNISPSHSHNDEIHARHPLEGAGVARLGHLEGQAHHQLHQGVEDDVLHVDMDKLIGEEAPHLAESCTV